MILLQLYDDNSEPDIEEPEDWDLVWYKTWDNSNVIFL